LDDPKASIGQEALGLAATRTKEGTKERKGRKARKQNQLAGSLIGTADPKAASFATPRHTSATKILPKIDAGQIPFE